MDDVINSLNAKNEVCEKSASKKDQSKLSLEDDIKWKLKNDIESFATDQRGCTNENLSTKNYTFNHIYSRTNVPDFKGHPSRIPKPISDQILFSWFQS